MRWAKAPSLRSGLCRGLTASSRDRAFITFPRIRFRDRCRSQFLHRHENSFTPANDIVRIATLMSNNRRWKISSEFGRRSLHRQAARSGFSSSIFACGKLWAPVIDPHGKRLLECRSIHTIRSLALTVETRWKKRRMLFKTASFRLPHCRIHKFGQIISQQIDDHVFSVGLFAV